MSEGDLFGDDPEFEKFASDFERRREALYERISAFMDEEDLDEVYAAQLLLEAVLRMRMTAYGMSVEKPSVAGLKMDLDRLRQEVDYYVREAKKGAEEYIAQVKKIRDEMVDEQDAE